MRIITLNVNGIRAATKKGLYQWLSQTDADVICLQEMRIDRSLLEKNSFNLEPYHCYFAPAQRKGYSGVAIFSKHKPDAISDDLMHPLAHEEGRYLSIDLGSLRIISLYLPSGSHNPERQGIKYELMEHLRKQIKSMQKTHSLIMCGDFNIAHTKKDIKNWRGNQKNSGFLPEERAYLDQLFNQDGLCDAFRCINTEDNQYTWWSNRGNAYANNVGWRIDYQAISNNLRPSVKHADIYKNERFSDHAPCIIDYDMTDLMTD